MSTLTVATSHRGNPYRSTALGVTEIAVLTTLSIVLFTVYPGLLWQAGPNESHATRFLVSYLAVIPAAAATIWWRHRRISKRDLTAAVIIVWSIKMVITVGMYHFMVAGDRRGFDPAPARIATQHENVRYSGTAGFSGRTVAGTVTGVAGSPVRGTVIAVAGVLEGKPFGSQSPRLTYTQDGFPSMPFVAASGSRITLHNGSDATVVMTGTMGGRTVFNIPIVPGSTRNTPLSHSGVLTVRARTGGLDARAHGLVSPTPYFQVVDPDGKFRFENVTGKPCELWSLSPGSGTVTKASVTQDGDAEMNVTVAQAAKENS